MLFLPAAPYILILACSTAILLLLGLICWPRRSEPAVQIFLVTLALQFIWTLGFLLEIASPGLEAKVFWSDLQFLGIAFLPLSLLALSLYFTHNDRYLVRWMIVLGMVPLLTNLVIWTNPWHHLFRGRPYIIFSGPFPILHNAYGPWFYWVHSWYGYALLAGSLWLLARSILVSQELYRRQVYTLLGSILFPTLVDFLYVAGISPIPQFNFTTIAFSISGIFIANAILRFRLFDILPVAKGVIFESIEEGVIICDTHNRLIDLNPAVQRITGITPSGNIGQPVTRVFDPIPALVEQLKDTTPGEADVQIEQDSGWRYYHIHRTPIHSHHDRLMGQVFILHDITEQTRLYHEVQQLATFDPLTNTYNRRVFQELSKKEIQRLRRYPQDLSLILVDIDQFKRVNDAFGHQVGDQVLKAMAEICQALIRSMDILGRYGGEEFVILLPETSAESAREIAERLREKISQTPFGETREPIYITASFGVATFGTDNPGEFEELFYHADLALYRAKNHGRNQVAVIDHFGPNRV
ncbi:MAG: histidine kinase N-terminal 7TM domain-containing protein [Anaerolineaceae bacterium]|nr:histidine kinase N-terminal 7TM domain-containing protein [Anaerolineaceae bacterium]